MSRRVGLLGGTFNPVHNGHLFLAEEALYRANLDHLIFMPNRLPPHKRLPLVTAEVRYEMLSAAIEGIQEFSVSRQEMERQGRSYTIDTLESLSGDDEIVFVCGADAFDAKWHRLPDVVAHLQTLLIANRAGFEFEMPSQLKTLSPALQERIKLMEFPNISISSSEIRERISEGRPYRFLIPEPVYRIITKSKLYASATEES